MKDFTLTGSVDFNACQVTATANNETARRTLGDMFGRCAGVDPVSATFRKSAAPAVDAHFAKLGLTVEVR